MKTGQILIAIVSLFTLSIAHAQYLWDMPPGMGPYFRVGIGPALFQDSNLKGFGYPVVSGPAPNPGYSGPSGKVQYKVGASGAAAIGFAINRYVGLDFQTGYTWARMNSVENYAANGSSMGNVPFLANLTLSLPIRHTNIIPYVGAGVGGSDSVFDAHNFYPQSAQGHTIFDNEDDVVFAWQAFAGVRFKLNPNISMGVGYDFFMTGNPTFRYPLSAPPPPNLDVEFEGVRTHSIMITLQANF
jgi:opacity protein-like surface antigen